MDADGVFRAVIAHRDPGVANWLDPAGHQLAGDPLLPERVEDVPEPLLRRVALSDLASRPLHSAGADARSGGATGADPSSWASRKSVPTARLGAG